MSGKKAKQQRQVVRVRQDEATHTVAQMFRNSLNKLRLEYARRFKIARQKFPEMKMTPCETCAFRTTADFTDGDIGFLETTVGLITALDKGHAFYCHMDADDESRKVYGENKYQPLRDEETGALLPCAGWMLMWANAPEPLDVREHLGDVIVGLAVEGNAIFNDVKS